MPAPALLTRSVRPPMASAAASTARFTASASRTSATTARPPTTSATRWAPSSLRSSTVTVAPSAANSRQVASPMPDAPPVTSTRRPAKRGVGTAAGGPVCGPFSGTVHLP